MTGIYIKRLLGALALIIGAGITGWFLYHQIWPTAEFKRGFQSIFQLAIPIACLVVGWKWVRYQGKGIDEITPPDFKCPELAESVKKARATMSTFLSEVDKGIDGAYIKFPLLTPQGLTEHIWAYVHFFRDDHFNVSLANTPMDEQQPAEGRRDVPLTEVEDWQIMQPDGKIKGAHSLIALFRYHENHGVKLSPLMKKQKSQLLDAL